MKKFISLFIDSAKELKSLRCITLTAMLGAIAMVVSSLTISVGNMIKVGFTFLPNNIVYLLFGPTVGAVYGATMDVLTYILNPTGPFFFGFTLSSIVTGIIFGVMLYKKPVKFGRILIATLLQTIVVSIVMNTYWLTLMLGNDFVATLAIRAPKSIIMIPIQSILMYTIMRSMEVGGIFKILRGNHVTAYPKTKM